MTRTAQSQNFLKSGGQYPISQITPKASARPMPRILGLANQERKKLSICSNISSS
jgi:hypothetical protein